MAGSEDHGPGVHMPAPSEPLVRDVLNRHGRGAALRRAMLGGWETMKLNYPDRAWWRRKSTRAAVVWEHTVDNAVAAFSDDDGITTISHHDTLSFIMDDAVLVRI